MQVFAEAPSFLLKHSGFTTLIYHSQYFILPMLSSATQRFFLFWTERRSLLLFQTFGQVDLQLSLLTIPAMSKREN